MATADEYAAWIVKNADKKGTPDFDVVAKAYQDAKTSKPKSAPTAYDPTEGMSTFEKVAAGAGKAIYDTGRGLGQMVGLVSRQDVEEARKLDEPLMRTGAGMVGNIGGNIGMALLPGGALKAGSVIANAARAPGAAAALSSAGGALLAPKTIKSAATLGAGMGAIQPSASTGETVGNVALGAGASALPQVAVRGYQAAKSAAEPFYESGKNQILGRLLNKVAGGGAADAVRRLEMSGTPFSGPTAQGEVARSTMGEIVPGSAPTVGQASGNAGLAALERTASQTDPQVMNQYAGRMAQQNAARANVLEDMAGTEGARDMFGAARDVTADQLYGDAFAAGINPRRLTKSVQAKISSLMQKPIIQDAQAVAERMAKNDGIDIASPQGSLQGMHYMKKALDDILAKGKVSGIGKIESRQIVAAQNDLIGVMDQLSPAYGAARAEFQAASRPINQMDIAASLADKSINKLTGNIQPSGYARALTDKTAAKAAGFSGATLENTMEPRQLQSLAALKDDLANSVYAQTAGRGVGSDTIQKLAYSNMIDAAGIPGFLRNMAPAQILGNVAGRGADALYGRANKELGQRLGEVMLDPKTAAYLMKLAPEDQSRMLQILARGGSAVGMTIPALMNGQK